MACGRLIKCRTSVEHPYSRGLGQTPEEEEGFEPPMVLPISGFKPDALNQTQPFFQEDRGGSLQGKSPSSKVAF